MGTKEQKAGVLPPWLWLWLVIYVAYVPGQLRSWYGELSGFYRNGLISWGENIGAFTYLTPAIPILLIGTVLTGILTVLVPRARAARLEKRFRLSEPSRLPPALEETLGEIQDFEREHAPGVRLKTNLLRQDQSAFVYPLGYRTTAIAIFGGMLRLWRSDREAAQVVLLHEIGHHRHGDAFIVGAGSPFIWFFRYGVLLCLASLLVLVVGLFWAHSRNGYFVAFVDQPLYFTPIAVFTVVLAAIYLLVLIFTNLTIPLAAIWCAELNADRFAVETQGSASAATRALHELDGRAPRWRQLFSLLSHPPYRFRR